MSTTVHKTTATKGVYVSAVRRKRRHADPIWSIKIQVGRKSKYMSLKTTDKEYAVAIAKIVRTKISNSGIFIQNPDMLIRLLASLDQYENVNDITLSELRDKYLDYSREMHTENTRESVVAAFNEFERYIGNTMINSIDTQDVNGFIDYKRRANSIYTARRCFATLSPAFKKACEWGYLAENPFKTANRVILPKSPVV